MHKVRCSLAADCQMTCSTKAALFASIRAADVPLIKNSHNDFPLAFTAGYLLPFFYLFPYIFYLLSATSALESTRADARIAIDSD